MRCKCTNPHKSTVHSILTLKVGNVIPTWQMSKQPRIREQRGRIHVTLSGPCTPPALTYSLSSKRIVNCLPDTSSWMPKGKQSHRGLFFERINKNQERNKRIKTTRIHTQKAQLFKIFSSVNDTTTKPSNSISQLRTILEGRGAKNTSQKNKTWGTW